jgi:hypothetical protein
MVSRQAMKDVLRWVSFAVERLTTAGRVVSLAEMRRVIEDEFGAEAVGTKDEELREALLELHGPRHASETLARPGASVTCTPMPEGWIPSDEFKPDR